MRARFLRGKGSGAAAAAAAAAAEEEEDACCAAAEEAAAVSNEQCNASTPVETAEAAAGADADADADAEADDEADAEAAVEAKEDIAAAPAAEAAAVVMRRPVVLCRDCWNSLRSTSAPSSLPSSSSMKSDGGLRLGENCAHGTLAEPRASAHTSQSILSKMLLVFMT